MKLFQFSTNISDDDFEDLILEFTPEFESLKSMDKLDIIQDALYELNKKFKDVNENF